MTTERWGDSGVDLQRRQLLSALCDGEAGAEDLQAVLAAWRNDPAARAATCETWHAYHLIGDVMRSEDLAGTGRDDVFLSRLRERLADEPVVIAPAAAERAAGRAGRTNAAARVRRRAWTAPVAAAAGVVAVAGVLVVTRMADTPTAAPAATTVVQAAPAATAVTAVAASAAAPAASSGAEQIVVTANGPLIRDARLEQYLTAHRQFGGSSALGVPSGFLRGATYEGPDR